MKIKVNKSELASKLALLGNIVKDNKIRPVLSQVLIVADEKIKLIATDLDQTLIIKIDGEIEELGKTTFNIKDNLELIKLTDSEFLYISANDNMLEIGNMSFQTYDHLEFPEIKMNNNDEVEIDRSKLIQDLNKITFAASQAQDNIEINCIRVADGKFAATDSYRMAVLDSDINLSNNCSIPVKSVENLIKSLNNVNEENVAISFESNKAIFKAGEIIYITRLIDLPFPDVNQIMENINTDKKAIIDSITFQKILKKILVVVRNNIEAKNGAIFEFSPGKMTIIGKSDKSKIKEVIKIYYSGEEVRVCLNCKFLIDYAKNIKNMLEINFSDKNNAFMLNEEGNAGYKYLTMPLALKD